MENSKLFKRREFIRSFLMVVGLLFSYGTFASFAGRFLYPGGKGKKRKMYLAALGNITEGHATTISTPTGDKIILARTPAGLKAFSSKCPHLGCQVLWRKADKDFFCPCHDGVFDAEGNALEGPPAKEGTNMKAVSIEVEGDSVYAWI